MSHYDHYYKSQAFPHDDDLGAFYQSSYQVQAGRGIGSILSSIIRWFTPIAKSGVKKLGEQVLKTGGDIIRDLTTSGAPPLEVIKTRAKEGTKRLQTELSGQGLGLGKRKRSKICPLSILATKRQRRKTINKKRRVKKSNIRDIFQK